jgi:iron complex outermembrane receptor protein
MTHNLVGGFLPAVLILIATAVAVRPADATDVPEADPADAIAPAGVPEADPADAIAPAGVRPADATDVREIEELVVTGTRTPQTRDRLPLALSVVDAKALGENQPGIGIDEPLRRVPGTFVQNSGNFAQDFRVQIRGFGTRAAFGIREVTVLVDGLPETLADGQTQVDTLELGSVRRIEVLRGPVAALYGNAAGGVLHFLTDDPPDRPGASLRLLGGSYGLARAVAQVGGSHGSLGGVATGSYFRTRGYRAHSAAESTTFLSRILVDVDDRTRVTLRFDGAYAPEAEDPGGLTAEQVREDRRQANPRNVLLDAGESVEQVRLAATIEHALALGSLQARVWGVYRDFDARLPVLPAAGYGIVRFDRFSPGGGARYSIDEPVLGFDQRLTIGFDAQHQHDDRKRYANEEGTEGALGLDQVEKVTSLGLYLTESISLTPNLEASVGLRWNEVRYAVDVRTPPDSDASGNRSLHQLSPGGGLVYRFFPGFTAFGNVTTAFQAPTTTELVNPDGPGFNPDIEPQTARSYELGLRLEGEALRIGASIYRIDIVDELVPFETPSGRVAFRNAGRSRRVGFELDWQAEPLPGLQWAGAVTGLRARYVDYTTDGGNYDGNAEPGIPPWMVFQEVSYSHESGLRAALEAQVVGGFFVDDANEASTGTYGLLNARFSWQGEIDRWTISPFFGVQNLTNAQYDGTVRLNAFGGRFYEPAAGRNYYGGLRVSPPTG